ncbi:hypothetical protein QBC38DRAFT_357589 [Podospora fimiseda]|uniref:F-box domain-containing protein n=1 Tax=Podospora fimiseda TaxID=252190 RepID=A0AAN7BV72_9PEZI|nr:hypothetical protein QBC38DRAFT_357589 [Podospora fimiseda]
MASDKYSSHQSILLYNLLQSPKILETLFTVLSKQDLCNLRLLNSTCCNLLTKRLFVRINVTFTPNTFTKPTRIQALTRIAHHIEHLSFNFPHSPSTFLPPLIHPLTGQEILFLYNPHTSMASALTRPKYGNSELGEILTQQYPPLFHAASNVPSFINAIKHLTNMRHLTIKTPGQSPSERYRRDIVDYALISLRIAVERSPLTKLEKLTLSNIHPGAFTYLRHKSGGFGTIPSGGVRWKQIKKLYISVEAWDFWSESSPGLDHLMIIDDYIRDFGTSLEKFSFAWVGQSKRGPCPIALEGDQLFMRRDGGGKKKLFNEVTGPMSPLPARPCGVRGLVVMPRLRCLSLRNVMMSVEQVKGVIMGHRETVREFDFENVALVGKGGSWEEALMPLTGEGNGEAWSRKSFSSSQSQTTVREEGSMRRAESAVSGDDADCLPSMSPAAEAASRELFEVDLEGFGVGIGVERDAFGAGVEEWAMGVSPEGVDRYDRDSGLVSDIASEGFSTKLLKRRKRRRTTTHHQEDESPKSRKPSIEHLIKSSTSKLSLKSSSSSQQLKHKHSRKDRTLPPMPEPSTPPPKSPRIQHHVTPPPKSPRIQHNVTPPQRTQSTSLKISIPIHPPSSFPVLLQPTIYDPSSHSGPFISPQQQSNNKHDSLDLSPTQRSIEQEEAEQAALRSSALKRAKEMVMNKLSKQFQVQEQKGNNAAVRGCGVELERREQGGGLGQRIRGGRLMFGKSLRDLSSLGETRSMASVNNLSVVSEGSGSLVVPLIFSRS